MKIQILTGVVIYVGSLWLWACSNGGNTKPLVGRTYRGLLFGKPYQIETVGDSTDYSAGIDSIITAYETCFNLADPNSVLSALNTFQRTDTVFAFVDSSRAFGIVYDLCRDYHRQTMQYYDPTTNPLKRHWAIVNTNKLGEPNLDSLFEFVGFDGSKLDLNERYDEGRYRISEIRKSDSRIEADFTDLAAAVALDNINDLLKEKKLLQHSIRYGRCVLNHGIAIDSLCIIAMGLTNDTEDQKVRIVNRAFTFKTAQDKNKLIDVTNGYPVNNEVAYVAVSAPTLAQTIVFAEAMLIMGTEKISEYYTLNPETQLQSFIFHQAGDKMISSSTQGFDEMLVIPESP